MVAPTRRGSRIRSPNSAPRVEVDLAPDSTPDESPLEETTRQFRGFLQICSGHGENLIDMENSNTRIGVGLRDWL